METRSSIFVTTPGPLPDATRKALESVEAGGIEVRFVEEQLALAELKSLVTSGTAPAAVILDQRLSAPLALARTIHRLLPACSIFFLADAEHAAQLRQQMTPVALIGPDWAILDPQTDSLAAAVQTATKRFRQQRSFRSTLDRLNLQITQMPHLEAPEYRRLLASDQHLAAILRQAQAAILSADSSGQVLSCNPAATTLFGRSQVEIAGQALKDLAGGDWPARIENVLNRISTSGEPAREEVRCERTGGETFFVDASFSALRDDAGRLAGFSVVAFEVTDRKRLEREMADLNAELERRVRDRTSELEEAHQEMQGFTYSVSHDLRAPLRAIASTAAIMREDFAEFLPGEAHRMLERQAQAANKLAQLIDDLLRLSRLARQEIKRTDVDLSALSREVAGQQPEGHAEITIEQGLRARADPALMRLVLENLIGNAVKFAKPGHRPCVTVGRTPEGAFFVRDEGIGFDMRYAPKLFLPFERLVTEEQYPGTGIGLANVQRIVHRHGGKVWAESEPGRGATFYFTLGG